MYLIAEIGFNHEGDLELAGKMIRAAAGAGADAVKFQTFRAGDIALPTSPHFSLIQKGEMSLTDHLVLMEEAQACGIDFLSTPFGTDAVDLLNEANVSAFKISSMDCTNGPLLEKVASCGKPIFLSTGMASLEEITWALATLQRCTSEEISILHCISHYPAQARDLNLKTIPFLQTQFDVPVGYSDHYPGIEACFAAAVLGAKVIETHFTLDKTNPEGDHPHSATPEDIKELRDRFTLFTAMSGSEKGMEGRPDKACAKDFRRGVYTTRALGKGDVLKAEDLQCTRPSSDFTPNDICLLEGKTLAKDLPANSPVTRDAIFFRKP